MKRDQPRKQKSRYVQKQKQEDRERPLEEPQKKKKKWKLKQTDTFGNAEKQANKNLLQDMMETKKKAEENQKKYADTASNKSSSTFSFSDPPRDEKRRQDDRGYNNNRDGYNNKNNNYRNNNNDYNRNYNNNNNNRNNDKYYDRNKEQPKYNNQGNQSNARDKDYKQNTCGKYLADSIVVEKDSHGLEDKIKKVKKLFKEQFKEALQIKIRQCTIYPIIFIQYLKEKNGQPEYMHIRDYFRQLKDAKQKQPLFEDIFGRLFQKVPNKFQKMAVFGIERAKELKFNYFNKESIFGLQQGCDVMFYYAKGKQNIINFTLIDKTMRIVQFSSPFIQRYKRDHPDQYACLKKFQKTVFYEQKEGDAVDLFDNDELSSDEDERLNFEEKTITELRNAVYDIIDKDITDLDNLIQKKYDEMVGEGQRDTSSARFKKMAEQYEDLSENRDNFVNTRNEVAQRLEHAKEDKAILKICLKKLIIAEKQLESKLPIVTKKRKIFDMLRKQNLLIIEGETGSGKSTQLPQMLCQFYKLFDDPRAKPVLVTQPRRLATRSLAQRVAMEMGQSVGGFVDYVASSGRQANPNAKIIFKLDRLVLDEMTVDPLLTKYSCLVIDEAHERTISIDVILGFVKELLLRRNDFKVIVTSASMDIHLFESYFLTKTLKVSGRTYPVTVTYKNYEKYKDGDKDQMLYKIRRVIDEEILHDSSSMKNQFKGHLLCFCSSLDEIGKLVKIYSEKLNRNVFSVFELHGKVSPGDQRKVFEETGKHKFIFANRIAETAITIDGVRVVIDPGIDIELVYDQKFKVSSMKLQEITQSSAKQRAGRSGRTGPGHCFRLYSEQNFKSRKPNKIPQIKNSSLETVVLRLKTLRIHDVINFPYIQKPDTQGLHRSVELLTLIGALNPQKGTVTKIGELIVKMPIEPFLARAIVESLFFERVIEKGCFTNKELPDHQLGMLKDRGVINTVIEIIALIINFSNLFFIKKDDREKGEETKYYEFSDEEGDFFFLDNIYRKYKQLRGKQQPNPQGKKRYNPKLADWIRKSFLNFKALNQVNQLIGEVNRVLQDYHVTQKEYEDEFDTVKAKLKECVSFRQVILSCLITSFSANLCKFSGSQEVGYTIVNQRRPIQIYGTSNLSLLGIKADWIICYDLYTNEDNRFFCKVAHKIDFDFMKKHIDKLIWKKFEIEDIEKKNPFYSEIFCKLPTRYIQQIKFDYYKGESDARFFFLREAFPCIAQETNTVSFFLQAPDKSSAKVDVRVEALKNKLNVYLKKLIEDNKQDLRHNYVANIYITFKDGFEIKTIQFNNKEFCVQAIISNNEIVDMVEEDSKMWGHCVVEDIAERKDKKKKDTKFSNLNFTAVKKRVKVFIQQQENKNNYMAYLQLLKSQYPVFELIKESLVDKRRKVPQNKILLHFFAGKCQKQNLLISYSSYGFNQEGDHVAQQMLDLIKNALHKKRNLNQRSKLKPQNMSITKSRNGINVRNCRYDEYEVIEELYELERQNLLTHKFKFPTFVKKFREPQISQAAKTNDEWKDEIMELLEKVNVKTQNLAIDIRGFYKPDKKKGEVITQFEKSLRVDMNVTLTTLDASIYPKLKNAYDGREKILGCEKLHIRIIYQHVIAIPSGRTFDALAQEYDQFVYDYRMRYPLMTMQSIPIQTRNKDKMLIKARSSNRADFVEPQRVISNLFTARMIKLESSEFKFIDKSSSGAEILQKIQERYNYKIYFGMERYKCCLKVYCQDDQIKPIEDQLKAEIKKKCTSYRQSISYRGKNLNKVKEVLQTSKNNLRKGEQLHYQILFQLRKIEIIADLSTFERVKNDILKLSNSEKGECGICADIMRNPYKFITCGCTFCWLCIADHLRAFRNNPNEEVLKCPGDDCLKPIAMQDARTLLTEDEFEKICDIKIAKYIQRNPEQYIACKHCEHIFSKKEVEEAGEINCDVCGKSECIKCHESHPNYTCDQWKDRHNLGKHLTALGVKQCPKCRTGIQKNGGCNHVECTNCKTHICWKCLATFATSKQCYDHLPKKCGGIFDRDADRQ